MTGIAFCDQILELRIERRDLGHVRRVEHRLVHRDLVVDVRSCRTPRPSSPSGGSQFRHAAYPAMGSLSGGLGVMPSFLASSSPVDPQLVMVLHHHRGESLDLGIGGFLRGQRASRAVGLVGAVEHAQDRFVTGPTLRSAWPSGERRGRAAGGAAVAVTRGALGASRISCPSLACCPPPEASMSVMVRAGRPVFICMRVPP